MGIAYILALRRRKYRIAASMWISAVSAMSTVFLAAELLKVLVGELRPDYYSRHRLWKSGGVSDRFIISAAKSFPSGHAATAFCGSTFNVLLLHKFARFSGNRPWMRLLAHVFLLFFSVGVGIQRVQTHKHFVHDVAFGAAIGILCATIHHKLMCISLSEDEKLCAKHADAICVQG